ncbi:MAG: aspartate kinase [Rhodobacteraceae bacterium]|nr:aspartate kinase [Paracoccaceae bacterium]
MSRLPELVETLFAGKHREQGPYGRLFVVSAFGGITDLLLEHKKSGKPGVYALYASSEGDHGWSEALSGVATAMNAAHDAVLSHPGDRAAAADFVRERIEGARSCLIDLQRLCSYGHFRLSEHLLSIRELLSGLGEAHSAHVTALALRRHGIEARCVDLSGWRDDAGPDLDTRLKTGLADIDITTEMPIVTGYAQCREGLMREFDRGYSEVTFSRIAALTGPVEAIIHKEFHLSSADPRLVGADEVRILGHSNYDVADQLANMGMEAIHPTAAKTLRRAAVPLRVTNAFDPDHAGTLIDDAPAARPAAEVVTGLDLHAFEVFEQDMVGVKGYDATILDVLKRHDVRIVSKSSNANTITHFLDAPLKALRRVERDIEARFPSAEVTVRALSLVSVIGRDLSGLKVLPRGLAALAEAGIEVLAAQQTTRRVDVQFVVARGDREGAVKALHAAVIGGRVAEVPRRAA